MKVETSNKIFNTVVTILAAALYALCMYLAYAFNRIGGFCADIGGIYSAGVILGVVSFILPFVYVICFKDFCLVKRREYDKYKVLLFVLCAIEVLSFIIYCIFINPKLIKGRDITMDAFLTIEMLVLPIVYAVLVLLGKIRGRD